MKPPHFVVGIDLGTTHTVVAYSEITSQSTVADNTVSIFLIEQRVTSTESAKLPLLPSFLYAPLGDETARLSTPGRPWVAGEYARRRSQDVPERVISSAKSWLSHAGVDRHAPILPWGLDDESKLRNAEDAPTRLSPVDASAQYLIHVRDAWDHTYPDNPLSEQSVILTVPASFDEVARELTLEATQRAGLSVQMLEEPQAAFYDWMQRSGDSGLEALLLAKFAHRTVLVCDIGGGTTDFSLLRIERADSPFPLRVVRIAVGDHLLLGGDNMDLALAHRCELQMRETTQASLSSSRFAELIAACQRGKEQLFSRDKPPEEAPITLLGSGAKLVGGSLSIMLQRTEATELILNGFFPLVAHTERPEHKRGGLIAFGLPYATDPAITRHLAWFLTRYDTEQDQQAAKIPYALLLNGGVFHAKLITDRLCEVLRLWTGHEPDELSNPNPDLAVARGAVAYGLALRGYGRRIEGGSARGYYIGLGLDGSSQENEKALCIMPRGAEPGIRYKVSTPLALLVNQPARFELFASAFDAPHKPGDLIDIVSDSDLFQRLPPITTVLSDQSMNVTTQGSTQSQNEIPVVIESELTEVGTLDLACLEAQTNTPKFIGRRFRLAFELRAPSSTPRPPSVRPSSRRGHQIAEALTLLDRIFGKRNENISPREVKDLIRTMERLFGERPSWTLDLNRALSDALLPLARGRRRSTDHERIFWLLAGYTLRPGFGHPLDPSRLASLSSLFHEGVTHTKEVRVWQQYWIAWRRVAAGLEEPYQTEIHDFADRYLNHSAGKSKRFKGPKPEALDELLTLATWLERVPPVRKADLGDWLLERTWTDKDPRLWDGLGRLGARIPTYASVHYVIAPRFAASWLDHLLREKWAELPNAPAVAFQLARKTGDRTRDISDKLRTEVERRLLAVNAKEGWIQGVREMSVIQGEREEAYGESLPVGLRLAIS